MWSFKKKIQKPKVFCEECKHYKYYTGEMKVSNKHDCYANHGKLESITTMNSPIQRSRTFFQERTLENAWDKNYYNNCEDYQPLFGENL
jgi:hypothetical protein